ncbi:Hira-domain-containing protein [Nadsonia fulvescens var. elongata DSM 6958]|uniref:Protein HIR n=1 Tax=Nadsonia fulvescens var. elongata DSM 6958 TaxID=857566 RepID=A0A1E3PI95_9ASCO|nr:Hira-domain-containing protein [Nadsonia fulvescens var. elongata DSM 6958]
MYIIKPAWLTHADEHRKYEIYSISVSPDGKRLASGGLDGKVRIWSIESINNSIDATAAHLSKEESGKSKKSSSKDAYPKSTLPEGPKQLCSMSTHTGAVTVVRFSPDGRYLATGSDDQVVLIWELESSGGGTNSMPLRREFGTIGEADTERWVVRKRLTGHDNDVQDLAWAPDGSLLVTVGLDSGIVIWSGTTFEKLKRLESHQSHVKGITFDPANKFFATASDDRTLKIFRYSRTGATEVTFSIEATITEPFKGSPLSTYFRRCSWSPDGNHIASANATNGPVTTIAIINRGTWDSDISLVGHDAPCEVASFCPRLFRPENPDLESSVKKTGADPKKADDQVSIIATSGQDKTLCIWNTARPRPIVVAHDIANKAITDLVWSPSGSTLFASSLDGTIVVVRFEEGDIGWPVPLDESESQLTRYGGGKDAMQIPESVEQLTLEQFVAKSEVEESQKKMDLLMSSSESQLQPRLHTQTQLPRPLSAPCQPPQAVVDEENLPNKMATIVPAVNIVKQKITITKDGRKRVAPQLISTTSNTLQSKDLQKISRDYSPSVAGPGIKHEVNSGAIFRPYHSMEFSKPSYALPKGGVPSLVIGNKRKTTDDDRDEFENTTGTFNTKKSRLADEIPDFIKPAIVSPAIAVSTIKLHAPKIRTIMSTSGNNDSNDSYLLEIRNGRGNEQEPTKIFVSKQGQVLFVDFIPKYAHLATGDGDRFWAVATEDGSIHIYSPSGRRLMPTIVVGSSISFLESQEDYLLAITSTGAVWVWNISKQTALVKNISVAPILDTVYNQNEKRQTNSRNAISQCSITTTGVIVISLTNGQGFTYNSGMGTWHRISEFWWTMGSQYWNSTRPYRFENIEENTNGFVKLVEGRTNEILLSNDGRGVTLQKMSRTFMSENSFAGIEEVISLGHLENRIGAAIMMGSEKEALHFMKMYSRRLVEECLFDRLEEFFQELLGSEKGVSKQFMTSMDNHQILREILGSIGVLDRAKATILKFTQKLS